MNRSESIVKIAGALAKFNGEVSKIAKDAANPFHKNKYSTLDNIVDGVRPVLTKYGLSIMQIPSNDEQGNVIMKTLLLHESGEFLESEPLKMKPAKNDPQGIGSCITYARRYQISAFLSLNTGEDDDGNEASGQAPPDQKKPQNSGQKRTGSNKQQNKKAEGPPPPPPPPDNAGQSETISETALKAVNTLMSNYVTANLKQGETTDSARAKLKDWLRGKVGPFENVQFMTAEQGEKAKANLKALINKQGKSS
jgi:hypothetical protein